MIKMDRVGIGWGFILIMMFIGMSILLPYGNTILIVGLLSMNFVYHSHICDLQDIVLKKGKRKK